MTDRPKAEASAKAHEVLRLHWQDKLKPEEIAERVGIRLAAVYRILHRGIRSA